ncbi:molybdenum cofactor guanylyltransferase MobA [Gilliamella sp. wkB178]|uniref:molybdenum cofactor guanylyltransferase MobA n=1 Tax=Gilliamella sp. wkB178 TaxID=3120259 RepID=UPI00080E4661|nr:molybdenum cofactor guanylyltransferase MobA [Gilliamella apicola]OCG06910.1 molybdenum cofactor guanylyltransferase MobA [Gilliamella apicola]
MEKLSITAIVLAGGQSSRMHGNDKGLLLLKGKPLFQHVIDRIHNQVDSVMINCNRHLEQYQTTGYPVFTDAIKGYLGPLAGIYSGLLQSKTYWNLFVSCDTPFLPNDLVSRLAKNITNNQAMYPIDGTYTHPTILLTNKTIMPQLKIYLEQGDRKLMLFLQQINAIAVDFSDESSCFININTPDTLNRANQEKS